MTDNIDRTLSQRQTDRDVKKMLGAISAVSRSKGYHDSGITEEISMSYEFAQTQNFNWLANMDFNKMFAPPIPPKPTIISINKDVIPEKSKANLSIVVSNN